MTFSPQGLIKYLAEEEWGERALVVHQGNIILQAQLPIDWEKVIGKELCAALSQLEEILRKNTHLYIDWRFVADLTIVIGKCWQAIVQLPDTKEMILASKICDRIETQMINHAPKGQKPTPNPMGREYLFRFDGGASLPIKGYMWEALSKDSAPLKELFERVFVQEKNTEIFMRGLSVSSFTLIMDLLYSNEGGKLTWENLTELFQANSVLQSSRLEKSMMDWAGNALQDAGPEVMNKITLMGRAKGYRALSKVFEEFFNRSLRNAIGKDVSSFAQQVKIASQFGIESLDLSDTSVRKEHIRCLKQLVSLQKLNLSHCFLLEDNCLVYLRTLPLRYLDLSSWLNLTDHGIVHLRNMLLETLVLKNTQITDIALLRMIRLPLLEVLDLTGCQWVTNIGMKFLIDLPIHTLTLNQCFNITDLGVSYLAEMPIHILELSGCMQITDAALQFLMELPLETLNLSKCSGLTEKCFQFISNIYSLKKLYLPLHLKDSPHLKKLINKEIMVFFS